MEQNPHTVFDHHVTLFTIFIIKSLKLPEIKVQLTVIIAKKDRNTSALVI